MFPNVVNKFPGGASVGYHILNKKSRKLFNRAFSLSGSVQSLYVRMETNDLRPQLRTAAPIFGVNIETDEQLIEALKAIPTSVWVEHTFINRTTNRTRFPTWAPVIESESIVFSRKTSIPSFFENFEKIKMF